ncbi:MBG domain-containing protein [Microbacterium elymi]|uniref:MBG domain-containing protein n=1 Tax=Microbacterium elymi TaxID=2909587 RepID=A0ABY5NGX6_9MICO|nr:MBG domain-containing protein [Microbacterium elymi]UUT34413.1 hypothetical protein L2X98_27790 [Microbacterium elymi]
MPTITPVYSGFVNDETAADLIDAGDLTAPTSCSTDYTRASDVGTYATSCTGAAARNYVIVSGTGHVTVDPQSVDVGIGGTMRYGEAPEFHLYPAYTGLSFDLSDGLTCTKDTDGDTLTGLHYLLGGYRIDPNSCNGPASDTTGNYSPNYTSGTFTVTTAPLSVTPSITDAVYGSDANVTPSYSGFVNGEDASVLDPAPTCSSDYAAGMPIGSYTANCTGGSANDYTLHYNSANFTVAAKSLSVTISATQTYGGTPVFSAKVSSSDPSDRAALPSDAAVSCTTVDGQSMTGLGVAFYRMDTDSCTGPATDADGNYAYTYVGGLLQVTRAPLTVTASGTQATYGDAAPPVDPVYSGFVNSDDAADLSTSPTCETTAYAAGDAIGDYESTCSGATSDNYTITYAVGHLTVVPAPLTVHPADVTMAFNSPVPPLTIGYDGFVAGDDATVVTTASTCAVFDAALTPITPLSRPGVYPITCNGGDAANYVFVGLADPATLTILDPTSFRLFVAPSTVFDGDGVDMSGGVLPPGTTVAFTFHSDPVAAGVARTGSDGTFARPFTVPAGTVAGAHEMQAVATLPDGTQLEQTAPLTVVAAPAGSSGSSAGAGAGSSAGADPATPGILAITGSALNAVGLPRWVRWRWHSAPASSCWSPCAGAALNETATEPGEVRTRMRGCVERAADCQ